jgi:low affinity Fe/Cu permease
MVFVIQNTQNRDSAAIQAKLDELLRSHRGARNEFIGIENLTDVELAEIIAIVETEADSARADPDVKAKLMRMHAGLSRIARTRIF